MFINKNNFPYEIKEEYIAEAQGFKIATLVYLFVYLTAVISFIVIAYPLDGETQDFVIWLAIFGIIPLLMLYNIFRRKLLKHLPQIIPQEHKWLGGVDCNQIIDLSTANEKKNFFQKLLREKTYYIEKEPAWDIRDILNRINLYGKIKAVERSPFFLGTIGNRLFRLDFVSMFNILSFSGAKSKYFDIASENKEYFIHYKFVDCKKENISVLTLQYTDAKRYGVKFKGFLLRMKPIKSIKSTILIRPKKYFAKKITNLQKMEIDTQGLFEIYTDNPQTLEQDLPQEFFATLVDYGRNIDKQVTILISPEGILCTKPASSIKDFFVPVLFTSLRNAFIREWAKYENFINLLEIFNLLEKEK